MCSCLGRAFSVAGVTLVWWGCRLRLPSLRRMPSRRRRLAVAVAACGMICATSHESYVGSSPNGAGVPDPSGGYVRAIGHTSHAGGGKLNVYGHSFQSAGNLWTKDLCISDSDGDGFTNGGGASGVGGTHGRGWCGNPAAGRTGVHMESRSASRKCPSPRPRRDAPAPQSSATPAASGASARRRGGGTGCRCPASRHRCRPRVRGARTPCAKTAWTRAPGAPRRRRPPARRCRRACRRRRRRARARRAPPGRTPTTRRRRCRTSRRARSSRARAPSPS